MKSALHKLWYTLVLSAHLFREMTLSAATLLPQLSHDWRERVLRLRPQIAKQVVSS